MRMVWRRLKAVLVVVVLVVVVVVVVVVVGVVAMAVTVTMMMVVVRRVDNLGVRVRHYGRLLRYDPVIVKIGCHRVMDLSSWLVVWR